MKATGHVAPYNWQKFRQVLDQVGNYFYKMTLPRPIFSVFYPTISLLISLSLSRCHCSFSPVAFVAYSQGNLVFLSGVFFNFVSVSVCAFDFDFDSVILNFAISSLDQGQGYGFDL